MNKIYLIRHGEMENVKGDPPLSQNGRFQAEMTAKHFKRLSINRIITSPMQRAHQTAQIIGEKLNVLISKDARLMERMNWGDHTYDTFEEFMYEWRKTEINRNYKPPFGLSSSETGEKMKDVIEEAVNYFSSENLLFVTHGGAISDLLRTLFDDNELLFFADPVTKVRYIKIQECSITELNRLNGVYKLNKQASTGHLDILYS